MSYKDNRVSSVNNMTVKVTHEDNAVLSGVTCEVKPGEILGLAGETGSGKTTLALTFLCYTAPGLEVAQGSVFLAGAEILNTENAVYPSSSTLRALRGNEVSYVPQDPGGALPPNMTIRKSFALVMKAHGIKEKVAHESRMKELFETVGLPCDETFLARYPHQLSGGQQQRVAIAMAFAHSPKVVVMDEPTTGLDAMTTRKVIDLVKHMSEQFHASIVFVSHDLRLLFSLADRVAVLHNGQIVETLLAPNFIDQTTHTYTQQLINAIPKADDSHQSEKHALKTQVQDPEQNTVLCVKRLSASYGHKTVIHELDFSIDRGTCLAFIGESGSGKTTTALCIAGIHGAYDGHIVVEGEEFPQRLTKRSLAQRKAIQYVFQNSTAALNPRKTAGGSIIAALRSYHKLSRSQAWDRAISLVRDVGLRADHLHALPHQLSGGQKQRVCLARALAAEPALLICDEVTSSLDVIVQSEIIDLLHHLQQERNLTMLFITHDFGLARIISDKTIVLYQGQVVESGLTGQVIKVPQHPYTQSLVQAASFNTSS